MLCTHCHRTLRDDSRFCSGCGATQTPAGDPAEPGATAGAAPARLRRSRESRRIAGVCGGLADYLQVDVTFVRAAWLVLSVVPGAVLGGVVAYLLAWLIIPADLASPSQAGARHVKPLRRSVADRRLAGVCGGLGEYFEVDATALRLLWIVLSVVPGAVVGGLAAYAVMWIIMPPAPAGAGAVLAGSGA